MDEKQDTRALKAEQQEREAREARLARVTGGEQETAQHERRADKAHYLKRKLEEREASERE